ncbi:MAG: DUF4429 domain-containing protein [Pirellulaceae bacterium]
MQLSCPHCSTVLEVASPAGTQVQCPTCQGIFVVPGPAAPSTATPVNSGVAPPPLGLTTAPSQVTENNLLATLAGKSRSTLRVYEHKIVISRGESASNFLIHGAKGEKSIFYSRISAVQLKPPGRMITGYLQFSISGGNESTRGAWEAVGDENTIIFGDSQTELAEAIVEYVENKIAGLPTPRARETLITIQDELDAHKLLQKEERVERQAWVGCLLLLLSPFLFIAMIIVTINLMTYFSSGNSKSIPPPEGPFHIANVEVQPVQVLVQVVIPAEATRAEVDGWHRDIYGYWNKTSGRPVFVNYYRGSFHVNNLIANGTNEHGLGWLEEDQ